MNADYYIIDQFNQYDSKELWWTESGYEIRRRSNISGTAYESVSHISETEARAFRLMAERMHDHWNEVHREHEDVAIIYDVSTACEWVYCLEKLTDGTYRIVDFPISQEEVFDFSIQPADEATVAQFLREAEEQRVIKEDLKFNEDCPKCPGCGKPGQWDFRFGLRFIIHNDPTTGAHGWCINPNHARAGICPFCNELGLRYNRENGVVEYLHSGAGDVVKDFVWHRDPTAPASAQSNSEKHACSPGGGRTATENGRKQTD